MTEKVYLYIKKRIDYVETHNDLSATIFRKYFLCEKDIQRFLIINDHIKKEIDLPPCCDLSVLIEWTENNLVNTSNEIERYVFEFTKMIIQNCLEYMKIPCEMSKGLKAEITSIQRVMFFELQETTSFSNLMQIRAFLVHYVGIHDNEIFFQDDDNSYLNLKPDG